MIGVIGAVKEEIETLNATLTNTRTETVCGEHFTIGRLNGRDVVTSVCGMGKVYAAICAQTMLIQYSPDVIINIGVGGALGGGLHIGDVVVGEKLVQHDFDLSPIGYKKGLIVGMGGVFLYADGRLCSFAKLAAAKAGCNCVTGTIATGDSFISSREEKARISSEFGAIVCDMEGASIAQVCLNANIRFCVIRAISDNADGEAGGDFAEFLTDAAQKAVAVIKALIEEY